MRGFLHKIQRFVAGLQNANLATRRRWLIGLSGISMILVVALWIIYLNIAFPSSGGVAETAMPVQETAKAQAPEPAVNTPGTSFFDTLWRGLHVLRNEAKSGLHTIETSAVELWDTGIGAFSKTNSYKLEKQNTPQVESTTTPDPVPPTPLPQP